MDKEYLDLVAKALVAILPDDHGFILMTVPFGDPEGRMNYVSLMNREDAINAVKTWLFHNGDDRCA